MNVPNVSILVTCHNFEKYIAQCLDSILTQETNYTYIILVADDASTDDSQKIIQRYAKQYPDKIISLLRKKNLGLIENYCDAIERLNSEFYACCNGDDFWHNPHKLQIQIEYLKSHPDVALVHTDQNVLIDSSGVVQHSSRNPPPSGNIFLNLLNKNFICTSTVCTRLSQLKESIKSAGFSSNKWELDDYPTWLAMAISNKIDYLPHPTCTYRIRHGSISRELRSQKRHLRRYQSWKMKRWFLKENNIPHPEGILKYYDIPFAYFLKEKRWRELATLLQMPDVKFQKLKYQIFATVLKSYLENKRYVV